MKKGQKIGERSGAILTCLCGKKFYRVPCLVLCAKYTFLGICAIGNIKIIPFEKNCSERIASEATRKKMRRSQLGRKHSLVTRRKMRRVQLGSNNAMFGRRHNASAIKKMRARKGEKRSPEARRNMVIAWIKRRKKLSARRRA